MSDHHTFRTALLLILSLVFPIALYFRIQSQATREKLDRRQEGLFILATLRPAGLIMASGLVAYLIDPALMAWSSVPLPLWVRWIGVAVSSVAAVLWIWTFYRLGRNLTDTVVTRQQHMLVTHGPYRWVRHPFYDAVALLLLSVSLIAANWFLFLAGAVVFSLLVIRTRIEEEKLLARFGESYRLYMERTGRFFPRIGSR